VTPSGPRRRGGVRGVYRSAETEADGETVLMSRNTLLTIVVVLLILWLLGWLYVPLGGLIHLLLIVILVLIIIRLVQGRNILP